MSFDAKTKVSLDSNSLVPCPSLDELIADDTSKMSFEKVYCQNGRRVGKQAHVTAAKTSTMVQILVQILMPV